MQSKLIIKIVLYSTCIMCVMYMCECVPVLCVLCICVSVYLGNKYFFFNRDIKVTDTIY